MITFDGHTLDEAEMIVSRINRVNLPDREMQMEGVAYSDGFSIQANFYRSRTIALEGHFLATSNAHLLDTIDTYKKNLQGINKNLDVDYAGTIRRYKATLQRFSAPEDYYHVTHIPYTVEFICQPFGYATNPVTISLSGITATSSAQTVSTMGTYKSLPTITLTFTSASGVSEVSIANTTNNDILKFNDPITTGDVLVINSETKEVTLNGAIADFVGPFPRLVAGSNSMTFEVTAAGSFDYNIDISYVPTFV